jgi:hypothetical protein
MKSTANRCFCPRLSEARHLLPLIRGQLAAAASRRPLATALELLPIVEDGLFGYELVPDRETHTYPIIGCNDRGEPVLRKTSYCIGAPGALQLVAVDGRLLSRVERAARYSSQRRDAVFPSWVAAAEQLLVMFPEGSRRTPVLRENMHRWLDQALTVAHTHLVHWDPFIQFFGLPNEAQLGFALTGMGGEHGELIFHEPDTWTLRWDAPPEVVNASWSVLAQEPERVNGSVPGEFCFPDRRMHFRRATDRGGLPVPWVGNDRRRARGRRALERRA